jgi:predicted regulator of Ras-like GTPase activity (Roadblock/LC7/MglB family)
VHESGGDEDRRATAEEYLRLLAREPNSLRFAEYADRLRRMEKLADAAALCEYGLARHPGYATGHVVMAEIMLDADMPEKAMAELREALRLDRCHPRAHVALGGLLLSQGEKAKAAAEFEAALLYSPGLPEALAGLAGIKGEAPDQRRTIPSADTASARKPGERPEWLSADRTSELIGRLADCSSIGSAAIAGGDGKIVAASSHAAADTDTAHAEVELIGEARSLASRLGAGRLRSVLTSGGHNRALYVPLGDLLLVAGLRPGTNVDDAARQVQAMVSAGPTGSTAANDG